MHSQRIFDVLRVVSAESCSQNFAEGYPRMGTHFMEGGYL